MSETWRWPVEDTKITDVSRGYTSWHKGIDIITDEIDGKNVLASRAGVVVRLFDGCINHDGYNAKTGIECDEKGCPNPTDVKYYAEDGVTVIDTKQFCNDGIGNAVFIKHADNLYSQYCHLKSFNVNVGDTVKRGQVIGKVGSSGESTDPHLHFSLSTGIEWWGNDRFNNDTSEIEYNYENEPPETPTTATVDLCLNYTSTDDELHKDDLEYTIGDTSKIDGGSEPPRTGYTFDGWYTSRSGGVKINTYSQIPEGTNILYAHWTESAPKITVTFKQNTEPDGGPNVGTQVYTVGGK